MRGEGGDAEGAVAHEGVAGKCRAERETADAVRLLGAVRAVPAVRCGVEQC